MAEIRTSHLFTLKLAVSGLQTAYGERMLNTAHGVSVSVAFPFSAGATGDVDFEIGIERTAGSGTITMVAGSTYRSFIMIEDKGQL